MPTYHYVQNQGKLMIQSRENGQKPQFGQFFDDFEVKYLQIGNFSEKQVSFKLKVIFSTNFRPKTKKIVRAVFEKNIKVSDFGLIWRPFCKYLQIKNFFQKSGSVTFLPLQSPNFMQKIRKILRAVSEKTALPTNQPTNYYQEHQSYRTLLAPFQSSENLDLRKFVQFEKQNFEPIPKLDATVHFDSNYLTIYCFQGPFEIANVFLSDFEKDRNGNANITRHHHKLRLCFKAFVKR